MVTCIIPKGCTLRMHSFIRVSAPRLRRSCGIKEADESTLVKGLSVSVIHHDLSDLGSLMVTCNIPKGCTLRMHSLIRVSAPRSRRSCGIKEADESTLVKGLSVSLMHHDWSDLRPLLLTRVIPKDAFF